VREREGRKEGRKEGGRKEGSKDSKHLEKERKPIDLTLLSRIMEH
jgi:hypothetical protein